MGHLHHPLLQGQEPLGVTIFMMGHGVATFVAILRDHLISHGRVGVALTLSSAKAYLFQDVQLLGDTLSGPMRLTTSSSTHHNMWTTRVEEVGTDQHHKTQGNKR